MKHISLLMFAALLSVLSCSPQKQNTISDLIQPVNLSEDSTTILLSDLFYAEQYNVKFIPNRNFKISHNKKENTVLITPINMI